MNYFELVNKCLVELNYKPVNAFAELTKNDHKKIKNIINLVNTEVCSLENWNFKLRKTETKLPAHTKELKNPIYGRIASIVIDGHVYKYHDKPEDFLLNKAPLGTYSSYNDKLLLPEFSTQKNLNIIYYTSNPAVDVNGEEKEFLENETDSTIIPSAFSEPILLYGTCMRLKANPQHVKFSYWLSMYNHALSNLKSKISTDAKSSPYITTQRV